MKRNLQVSFAAAGRHKEGRKDGICSAACCLQLGGAGHRAEDSRGGEKHAQIQAVVLCSGRNIKSPDLVLAVNFSSERRTPNCVSAELSLQGLSLPELSHVRLPQNEVTPEWNDLCMGH